MKQVSLNLSLSVKKTRKRVFLDQMDKVVPLCNYMQHCNIVSLADKLLGLTLAFRMTSEMSVR